MSPVPLQPERAIMDVFPSLMLLVSFLVPFLSTVIRLLYMYHVPHSF